jgi:hypothetical protein
MKVIYEWLKRGRHAFLRRVELFTQEDVEKKPAIPESGSVVARLKAASDLAHSKRRNIIEKLRGRNGKGY